MPFFVTRLLVYESKMQSVTVGLALVTFILVNKISKSEQHGFMREPPSRASAWLTDPDFASCCKNYEYNQMFCGGFMHQWELNGGKCGICGDPWDGEKKFEKGGSHYLGKIVRNYDPESIIPVTIQVIILDHFFSTPV